MVIGNGFFSDYESRAIDEMKKMVRCDVKRCVFPSSKNLTYYISEHGDLFSMQKVQGRYLTRGPKKMATGKHGKRKDGGITHRLSMGRAGREKWIAAELLVYCTFILGRWESEIKILFKNGKATDIRPGNLELPPNEPPPEYSERMAEYQEMYQQDFNRVVKSVKWWCGLSVEDAKDVASQTFIWLCTDGYKKGTLNSALWTYWSRKRGYDFAIRAGKIKRGECYDVKLETIGSKDRTVEVDLFHIQPGVKRQRYLTLWSQGYTTTDIAEMERSTIGNIGSSVTRSIQFLQKYFRHEKEYLRT